MNPLDFLRNMIGSDRSGDVSVDRPAASDIGQHDPAATAYLPKDAGEAAAGGRDLKTSPGHGEINQGLLASSSELTRSAAGKTTSVSPREEQAGKASVPLKTLPITPLGSGQSVVHDGPMATHRFFQTGQVQTNDIQQPGADVTIGGSTREKGTPEKPNSDRQTRDRQEHQDPGSSGSLTQDDGGGGRLPPGGGRTAASPPEEPEGDGDALGDGDRSIDVTSSADAEPAAGDGEYLIQTEGLEAPPRPATWWRQLAQSLRNAPAGLMQSARSPLLYMVRYGQIPSNWHDVHAHFGGLSGTYDIRHQGPLRDPDFYMTRLTERQLEGGRHLQFYFPVAPHIGRYPVGVAKGILGAEIPRYYAAQTAILRNNVIGTVHLEGGYAVIKTPLKDSNSRIVAAPMSMPRADFETLIGRQIPLDVRKVDFMTTPSDCNLHYQGPEADRESIEKLTRQIKLELRALGESPTAKSHFVGLTGGSPTQPDSYKTIYDGLRYTQEIETANELPAGTLQVGMMGEITIDKENVLIQAYGQRSLLELDQAELDELDRFVSPMKHAGGLTIIHCDIGKTASWQSHQTSNFHTAILPSDNANFGTLKAFFQRNGKQDFIWAHAGASYSSRTDPAVHLPLLREMLTDAPNVKIDLSWTATNKEIFRDIAGWARLIADFPDRFIWGSDTIAAAHSSDPEAIKGPMKSLEKMGFLAELDKLDPDLKERFLAHNFEETILPAQARVTQWRSDPEVAEWLRNRGYDNGTPPPKVFVKDDDGVWSDTLQNNEEAFQTSLPWWRQGPLGRIFPQSAPETVDPRPPGETTASDPGAEVGPDDIDPATASETQPTPRDLFNQLWSLISRPRGVFLGASTRFGGGFVVVPWKATQPAHNLDMREVRSVLNHPGGAASSLLYYFTLPPAVGLPAIGGFEGTLSVVTTARTTRDDIGLNATYQLPLPLGKMALFFNVREDELALSPLLKGLMTRIANTRPEGLPALLTDFVNGELPKETTTISGNVGIMYSVSDAWLQLQGIPREGRNAIQADLYTGIGWNATANFSNGTLSSIWINDVQIPVGNLPGLLKMIAQSPDFLSKSPTPVGPTLVPELATRYEADLLNSVGSEILGISPWVSVRSKLQLDPSTGDALMIGSKPWFRPIMDPSERLAAEVYTVGIEHGVLDSNHIIVSTEEAGQIIDRVAERLRESSEEDYDSLLNSLANPYRFALGSSHMQRFYEQMEATVDDGWPLVQQLPRPDDWSAVRSRFQD